MLAAAKFSRVVQFNATSRLLFSKASRPAIANNMTFGSRTVFSMPSMLPCSTSGGRARFFATKKSAKKGKSDEEEAPAPALKSSKKKEEEPEVSDKDRALQDVLKEIEHAHGKGSVMRLGKTGTQPQTGISTGSIALDAAIGIGGLPRGRITEIYGPESSGKTTLALHVIANAQKAGGKCTFIDAEHALDPVYAAKLGVNTEELLVSQPNTGEQALEIADMLIKSHAMDVVVVDSVAALVPKAELEGDMGQPTMGAQARLMSQALRKLTASLGHSQTVLIFINQIRNKIGVMFGNPETTSGGNALKFHASIRLDIRRIGSVKKGEEITGNSVKVKVVKNKLAPPFRSVQFDIDFGKGISRAGEIIDLGVQSDVLSKQGSWYTYGQEQLAQGREKVKALLEENTQLADRIEANIREKLNPAVLAVEEEDQAEDDDAPVPK